MGARTRFRDWINSWVRLNVYTWPGFAEVISQKIYEMVPGLTIGATYVPNPLTPTVHAPAAGVNGDKEGEIYLSNDLTPGQAWVWQGGSWNLLNGSGGGGGPYILPTASGSVLGGVKVGTSLTIDGSGVLDYSNPNPTPYTLPTATAAVLGGVKVGTSLSIVAGVLDYNNPNPTPYTLPTATDTILGGIKVGTTLAIVAGVLDYNNPNPTPYTLPAATDVVRGGITVGPTLSIVGDTLDYNNPNPTPYVLPTASGATTGGIKVGPTLDIVAGVLDYNNPNPTPYVLPIATGLVLGGVKVGVGLASDPDGTINAYGYFGFPRVLDIDRTLASTYGMTLPGYFEITAGLTLELATNSMLEIT